jgi:SAM-dependent methyltransferase
MADANAGEAASWQGDLGQTWIALSERLDATQRTITEELIRRARIRPGDRVLDVGCGTGGSARAAARAAAPGGRVTGIDIAPPMLEAAAGQGGARIDYLTGDAQDHPFPPRHFDRVISQFGLMFFADSAAGFANLLRAARPGGRLAFAAWAATDRNPWFDLPRRAAVAELGDAPGDPDGPGPTRFRDVAKTAALVAGSGWGDVAAVAVTLHLTPPGSPAEVSDLATRLGPAARLLRVLGGDDAARARIRGGIEEALAPYVVQGRLRIPAVVNFFTATAP